jgi:hypothetical protein
MKPEVQQHPTRIVLSVHTVTAFVQRQATRHSASNTLSLSQNTGLSNNESEAALAAIQWPQL